MPVPIRLRLEPAHADLAPLISYLEGVLMSALRERLQPLAAELDNLVADAEQLRGASTTLNAVTNDDITFIEEMTRKVGQVRQLVAGMVQQHQPTTEPTSPANETPGHGTEATPVPPGSGQPAPPASNL